MCIGPTNLHSWIKQTWWWCVISPICSWLWLVGVYWESLHLCLPGSFYLLCSSLVWGRAVLGSGSEFAAVPSLPVWGTVEGGAFFRVLLAGCGCELLIYIYISSWFNLFCFILVTLLNNQLVETWRFIPGLGIGAHWFKRPILPFLAYPSTIFPPTVLFPHDGAHSKKSQNWERQNCWFWIDNKACLAPSSLRMSVVSVHTCTWVSTPVWKSGWH